MNKIFYTIILYAIGTTSFAQKYNPLSPPNTYRNSDNPNYWKNRMPFPGYWQQDVQYSIKANLDEQTGIISGTEKLIYLNNSTDDLEFAYFHLYQNAFQPGSYYDNLQKNTGQKPKYGLYESQMLGTKIETITVEGVSVTTELDNTILKVILPHKLKSGQSVTFNINFKTYFDNSGNVRRRMKTFNSSGYKHFDGVHWYPRICVYDRKFGWTTDQHLGHEFYGDFGTYDVELTFSSNYVVGATGFLLNRSEVLPPALRKQLDIKNFAAKLWNSPASEIIPYKHEERKTWKYHAENVHDFAFTADPTYRIGEAEWNGIKCYALSQESHAAGWQNAADYVAKIIKTYSEDFGMYTYHKMIVADARDGMEYPMLTLDGGFDPSYRGLFAHEVGHNWFFGQVGNNETYRAMLDEGFTTFITGWCLEKLEGDTISNNQYKSAYLRKFKKPVTEGLERSYDIYLKAAMSKKAPPINVHSDYFNEGPRHGGGYREVYFKTATMLKNLQYVLGDELFQKAMQHYFAQWKICHPYIIDFRNSIIHYTGFDLNWFFDQWINTSKNIDYAVKSIRKTREPNRYLITFKRIGEMQMPIDFEVTANDGKKYSFYIPNTWWVKKTDAQILPKWIGWDAIKPYYTASVDIPTGIQKVRIDPSNRMADINMLNNSNNLEITTSFDHRLSNRSDRTRYEAFVRPDIWYNGYDGIKAGMHINGNYMLYKHRFDLNIWFNTGLAQHNWNDEIPDINQFDRISFRFHYSNPIDRIFKGASVFLSAKSLDGMQGGILGLDRKSVDNKTKLSAYIKTMYRKDSTDLHYLLYPDQWTLGELNNTLNLSIDHKYKYNGGMGFVSINMKTSAISDYYNYSVINCMAIQNKMFSKMKLKTRAFIQYGVGDRWPAESRLFLAGSNPEELMENPFTRANGFIPSYWSSYGETINHFHAGGGLNLRGYAGYLSPYENDSGLVWATNKGNSGASINAELEFNRFIPFNPKFLKNTFKLVTYLFGDAGMINSNKEGEVLAPANLRIDAGAGVALTINRWGVLETVNPLTIRFDMPFWLNRLPAGETDYFAFRWMLGVNRAF